ncbi:hypothetical protein FQN57_005913 [Myotisia sp. PD_48]|nr:hypothetical protein FQN57_005913 [Myotisia sp. PD_48]
MAEGLVEVAGEANPLTLQNIILVLTAAASSVPQQVQTGTKQLQNWEKREGYYPLLQEVFVTYTLPLEVRYLSIIQLKNGVDKYWRKATSSAIKLRDKQQIKERIIQAGVSEPANQLALHNALIIAKIFRNEFPADWPDAFNIIIECLRSSIHPDSGANPNPLLLSRTLLILLQVVKELSTARLEKIKRGLWSVAPELFHIVANIYVDKVQKWTGILEGRESDASDALQTIETSVLALKILRRLMVSGFEYPNRDSPASSFWALSLTHLGNFYTLLQKGSAKSSPDMERLIGKHILQFSKLHLDMARTHPAAFGRLPQTIEMMQSYWGLIVELGKNYGTTDLSKLIVGREGDADDQESPLLEKIGLKALFLLRTCAKIAFYAVHTFKYQGQEWKDERDQTVQLFKTQMFNEDFVVQVMEYIVTRFFVFRASDLREWEEEPEEWERREEELADAWEFSIRSCAEKLFLDLVVNFKELLVPKLLTVFYTYASKLPLPAAHHSIDLLRANNQVDTQNKDILLKDSLYSAVGQAAATLDKELDFNAFLLSTLVPEIQIQEPGYNIIRRRIAILLGQWVPIKHADLDKTAIYSIFQHLLNKDDPTNDQVVRVTAGRQLKLVLNTYDFSAGLFQPFSVPILQSLMQLIQEAALSETQMGLLETVRAIVVKMERHISPFADQIISMLPSLWEKSGEEHLMKQAILTLLTALIQSMNEESTRYHSIILPLIQKSIEPGSDTLVYLLDESLDLWEAVLSVTPAPASPELLGMFPLVFSVFEMGDAVRVALDITESYILLAPNEFLNGDICFKLLSVLESFLHPKSHSRIGIVPYIAELLIRTGEYSTGESEQVYASIAKAFVASSFLPTSLAELHGAYKARIETGPNRTRSLLHGVSETDYFSVLARLALASPLNFVSAVTSAIPGEPINQTFKWLLSEWFSHFDQISDINKKKLHCLAVTHLLTMNGPTSQPPLYLLDHMQSYLTVWTSLIIELSEGADDSDDPRQGDYLVTWNKPDQTYDADGKYSEGEQAQLIRRRAWTLSDPTFKLNIRDFVRAHLHIVVDNSGGLERFRADWLVNVDSTITHEFGQLGIY